MQSVPPGRVKVGVILVTVAFHLLVHLEKAHPRRPVTTLL